MMDLKIVIFALLLQHIVGYSSQSIPSNDVSKIERAEPSDYHHHHRRSVWGLLLRLFKHQKNKDDSKTQFSSNMKWEQNPNLQNVVSVSFEDNKDKEYYIARDNNNCEPQFTEEIPASPPTHFLVNPDNFENLEWKPLSKFLKKIPPFSVETCDGHFIARNKLGLGYIKADKAIKFIVKNANTKGSTEKDSRKDIEVLTINFNDIAEEYLTNVKFNAEKAQRNNKPAMTQKFTVVNNNCNVMKQQVKINNNFEETASYQIGSTLLVGGTLGININSIFQASLKSDATATETESNSKIKKTGKEYTQELEIPPSSSCNLVINSTALVTTVLFTGDLTRVYKNDETNTISISGNYSYQESAEIKTNFESCTKLPVICVAKSP